MSRKQGRWIKPRKDLSKYPETEQQKKIKEAGQKIKEQCTGKKGSEFQVCRADILEAVFGKKDDRL